MKPPRALKPNAGEEDVRDYLGELSRMSSNISFGGTMSNSDADQNMVCWKASGTTPAGPDTEFTVTSSAGIPFFKDGHVPIGFKTLRVNKAAILYDSGTAWTATTIFLKCNVATVAFRIILF